MSDKKRMPLYQSHKKVRALKIVSIQQGTEVKPEFPEGSWLLMPEESSHTPVEVEYRWVFKHDALAPGYFVEYEDGYTSWSPVVAFENGYTRIEG